jgi:hypothetical protein
MRQIKNKHHNVLLDICLLRTKSMFTFCLVSESSAITLAGYVSAAVLMLYTALSNCKSVPHWHTADWTQMLTWNTHQQPPVMISFIQHYSVELHKKIVLYLKLSGVAQSTSTLGCSLSSNCFMAATVSSKCQTELQMKNETWKIKIWRTAFCVCVQASPQWCHEPVHVPQLVNNVNDGS